MVLVGLPLSGAGCRAGQQAGAEHRGGGASREASRSASAGRFEYQRVVMGVKARIVLEAASESQAFDAANAAFGRLAQLNARLSDYQHDSELNQLAATPVGTPRRVSEDLWNVLEAAKQVHQASNGAFDVTVGHATRLWREARKSGRASDANEVAQALARMDMDAIELEASSRSVTLTRRDLAFDLGGIAKGYAAQEAVRALRECGITRCLVALAGDIATGDPPSGEQGWRIDIQPGAGTASSITLANASVSTSGSSEQFIELGGMRYSHILDPRTGMGTTSLLAVTVMGPDGARTDALATALCILPVDDHAALMRQFPNFQWIVHPPTQPPNPTSGAEISPLDAP